MIELEHFRMAYDDFGQGTPLVLLHGFPLSRAIWAAQIAELSAHHRLIAPDLRGHGDSEATPGPYSMEMLADDCLALLDVLEIQQPVILCGLSMGGYISLAFFRNYPARVASLILAATRASADSPEAQINRDKAISVANQQGAQAISDSMLPKMFAPETSASNPTLIKNLREMMANTSLPGIIGALQGMKNRQDSTPLLPLIKVPALVCHGANDQLIPVAVAQEMAASIPNAQLNIIPRAGHLLNLEQPALFNQAIADFIYKQF